MVLRQAYLWVAKRAAILVGHCSHAHHCKRARRAPKFRNTRLQPRRAESRDDGAVFGARASILENHTGTVRRFQSAADVVRRPLVRGGD